MNQNEEHTILENEPADMRSKNKNANIFGVTDRDLFFAKERYKLHQSTPDEGVSIEILQKYFSKKYGF